MCGAPRPANPTQPGIEHCSWVAGAAWFEVALPLPGDLLKERDAAKAENEELKKEIARLKAARNGAP